jgi:hypothetical protein
MEGWKPSSKDFVPRIVGEGGQVSSSVGPHDSTKAARVRACPRRALEEDIPADPEG